MTQDDMVLASQLHTSREFAMDSQVNVSMQNVQYHGSHSMSRQSLSADSFAGNTSFVEDSQMLDHDGNNDHGPYVGMSSQSKGGSRSSANNEVEMRQLYIANRHRDLQDVAEELHGNERGPNSERTRQVFAMLWYVGFLGIFSSRLWANNTTGSAKYVQRAKDRYLEGEFTPTMPPGVPLRG